MNVVKNIVENTEKLFQAVNRQVFIDKYALPRTNKKVATLKAIERSIKKIYNIDTKVIYVSEKHKHLLIKDSTKGYYHTSKDCAVIFINNNYRDNVTTLCHELTHAYQNYHMHDQYIKSTKALHDKKVTYAKAWHEVHARQQAKKMCSYFLDQYVAQAV